MRGQKPAQTPILTELVHHEHPLPQAIPVTSPSGFKTSALGADAGPLGETSEAVDMRAQFSRPLVECEVLMFRSVFEVFNQSGPEYLIVAGSGVRSREGVEAECVRDFCGGG